VITADVQDQITLCNRAAASILGHASAEIVGTKIEEIMPAFANDILPHLDSVRRSEQPIVGLELSQNLPERGMVDWRFNLSPLKDAGQKTQGVAIVLDDMTERKKLEAQRGPAAAHGVAGGARPDRPEQPADRRQKRDIITILFADIRGFTAYSEKHTPEELVAVLNRYLAAAAEAVLAYEGTVDKFLGDAVMAWYNAPLPQPDHTLRAVKSALAIRDAVAALHAECRKRRISISVWASIMVKPCWDGSAPKSASNTPPSATASIRPNASRRMLPGIRS
jgi:PAS domain S-box-containing protein